MSREHELTLNLQRTENMIMRFLNDELSCVSVSYTQAIVLCKLAKMPLQASTQKELKAYLKVTAASVSDAIKRMVNNGFIEQKEDDKDHRINVICLTAKGASLVPSVYDCLDKAEKKIYDGFSREEKECVRSLLERMQNNLSNMLKIDDKGRSL